MTGRRQRRRGEADAAIVRYLADQSEAFGLDIGDATLLRPGRMYPALQRLADSGALTVRVDDTSGRTVYALRRPPPSTPRPDPLSSEPRKDGDV